jgi:hypothetical protein
MDSWEKEHREDIGTEEQDLGHHTTESERIARGVDPVEGFQVEEPTPDQLDADDGYVDEPPEIAAEDLVPTSELDDQEPLT